MAAATMDKLNISVKTIVGKSIAITANSADKIKDVKVSSDSPHSVWYSDILQRLVA